MKKLFLCLLLFFLADLRFLPEAAAQIVTEQSKVTFSVSHISGTVEGSISGMQGTVKFDEKNPAASSMQATVEAKTIDTGNGARDSDLRKPKFLDVERYPQLKFVSKTISATAEGYQVTGDLTIKDVTREVTIPFKREAKGAEAVYSGSFSLLRKDYHVGGSGFPPVGKKVIVNIRAVVRE